MIYRETGEEDRGRMFHLCRLSFPRNIMMSLWCWLLTSGCWHFSSEQVILGPCDEKSHSLPEETTQQDETQTVSSEKNLLVCGGNSNISHVCGCCSRDGSIECFREPDGGTTHLEQKDLRGWTKQIAFIYYYFLKLFTSASYKTWNVKRPRVNHVLLNATAH